MTPTPMILLAVASFALIGCSPDDPDADAPSAVEGPQGDAPEVNWKSIDVRQVDPIDETLLEEWQSVTDDVEVLGVDAYRHDADTWPWQVFVSALEFVRSEPLETELATAITDALQIVHGVERAVREDREVWAIEGSPSGDDLVRATVLALGKHELQIRQAVEAYDH